MKKKHWIFLLLFVSIVVISIGMTMEDPIEPVLTDEALRIHHSALVVDGHNDLPDEIRSNDHFSLDDFDLSISHPEFHTDIPRLLKGGVGAQFWSAFVPVSTMKEGTSTLYCLEQMDLIMRMVRKHPDVLEMAYNSDDIVRIYDSGKIASLIGIEGGHAISNSLGALRAFYQLGARYLTLTHSDTLDWADSATDEERHGGLTELGETIINEMNHLGMLVDISHVSADTMRDVLRISRAPVIASHSSAYALSPHARNIPDDVLHMIKENGGVVMVNFYPGYLTVEGAKVENDYNAYKRELEKDSTLDANEIERLLDQWDEEHKPPKSSVYRVVDHIEHIIKIAGIDHVGLGSDFDGIPITPEFLEDVSYFPYITQVMIDRGYDEVSIRKILGENFIRVFRTVEKNAREMEGL